MVLVVGRGPIKVKTIHSNPMKRNDLYGDSRTQQEALEDFLNHEDTGQIINIMNMVNDDIWVVYVDEHNRNYWQKRELEKYDKEMIKKHQGE